MTDINGIIQLVRETLSNNPQLSNQEIASLCHVPEGYVFDIRQLINEDKSKIKNKILILPKWSDLEIAISCDVSESDVSNIRKYLYPTGDKVENLQCIQSTTINNLRSVYIYILEYERKSIMDILKSIRKLEKNLTRKYKEHNINKIINEINKEEESLVQIINKILMRLNVQN